MYFVSPAGVISVNVLSGFKKDAYRQWRYKIAQ